MSFLTGTNWETISLNDATGTALTNTTTETAINDAAGMGPQPYLPAGFFLSPGSSRKGLRIVARGIFSTPSSGSGAFIWNVRFATAEAGNTGVIGLGCASFTPGASTSGQIWELEGDITIGDNTGASGATTVRGSGMITSPGFGSQIMIPLYAAATGGTPGSPGTTATFDPRLAYFVSLNVKFATALTTNIVQCLYMEVIGKN